MNLISPPKADWQRLLSTAVCQLDQLLNELHLTPEQLPASVAAARDFPLRVPRPYLAKIRPGDPQDPLLLQVLPQQQELNLTPGFTTDPLHEAEHNPLPGLIHKYQGRVLLILSGACAINCRYCFRRHFPYSDNQLSSSQRTAILDYLRRDPSIHEVILSGGDPLAVPDQRLFSLLDELEAIEHLTRIRIHSRLPVVIPQRITPALCQRLANSRLHSVLVLHINHPHELDSPLVNALQPLRQAGVTLLNQAVLLKGINDRVECLATLSEQLFAASILPYYLFVLDQVQGAAHFQLSREQAQGLFRQLQARLPGYLVPRLAQEIPGRPNKTLLSGQ